MSVARRIMFGAAASASLLSAPASSAVQRGPNPIRKVVTMLQNMQKKVTEDGKKQEDLFEKFMCYCKSSGGDLGASIEAATTKIEALSAELKGAAERKAQSEVKLEQHKAARGDAQATMKEASALRQKENTEFNSVKADSETNIAAISKAVVALENGSSASFLQMSEAALVRKLAMDAPSLEDGSRQELLAFLSSDSSYAPQSGDITGILKQLGDNMKKDLADATNTEANAVQNFGDLMGAKKKEVSALQTAVESQMSLIGNLGVSNSEGASDLEDTKEALAADQKFKQQLEEGCSTKSGEWDEIKKTRAEELLALSDTIKVLNDDDALDLFGNTLPSPAGGTSLLQVDSSAAGRRSRAATLVRSSAAANPQVGLIALALQGNKVGFDKVLQMIDNMANLLKQEQVDDDSKRDYCGSQLDQAEDKLKSHELSIKDSETAIEEMKGALAATIEESKSLRAGIKALDKNVAEATAQRKQENEEHKALVAADGTAKEVLAYAQNRLQKFYNPKLYKAPTTPTPTEQQRLEEGFGVATKDQQPLGGIAGTGIGAFFAQVRTHSASDSAAAPPPPPETFGAYTTKSEENNGVIAMIDLLVKDLDKEMQEAAVEEANSQKNYESLMEDAQAKRAADSKSLGEKETIKASTEEALQNENDKKTATTKELLATADVLHGVHAECDWLVQNYEARKTARVSEIESLGNAMAVLNGADYSFLQDKKEETKGSKGFLAKFA